jgi:hypothetical protein
MKNFFVIALLLPFSVFASIGGGVSFHNLSDVDSGYGDLGFRVNSINGVWESARNDNLAFQVKLGLGLSKDTDRDDDGDFYDFEVNNLLQLKGMYFMNDNFYAAATYSRFDIDTYNDYTGESGSDSENDLGFMLGFRKNNLDLFFGPTYDEGSEGKIMEFGFTYFFN